MQKWKLKTGVSLEKLHPLMLEILPIIADCFEAQDSYCIITSGDELTEEEIRTGKKVHLENSKHYIGQALDFRTRHLHNEAVNKIWLDIRKRIGSKFDMESLAQSQNHIHIEIH